MNDAIPDGIVSGLIGALDEVTPDVAIRRRRGGAYAMRDLLRLVPAVRELSQSEALFRWIEPTLGPSARCIRGLLLDKTRVSNWKVAWHQDLAIAVRERAEVPGFGPWSVKAGVPHVQPPTPILESMLTVRVHLDDCDEDNGPLRVVRGSHRMGVLNPEQVAHVARTGETIPCLVSRGGAMLMRPLLLHASSSARRPGRRRVIHLEYTACDLSGGLRWHDEP